MQHQDSMHVAAGQEAGCVACTGLQHVTVQVGGQQTGHGQDTALLLVVHDGLAVVQAGACSM